MRVILDANVYISYLLLPDDWRTISQVVTACLGGGIELYLPQELIDEVRTSITKSTYLVRRVTPNRLDAFLQRVISLAAQTTRLSQEFPQFSRDPSDDYLIAYGLIHQVDYLVTGDPDLLVLKRVQTLTILRPIEFLERL